MSKGPPHHFGQINFDMFNIDLTSGHFDFNTTICGFLLGFLVKKTQNVRHKKDHPINMNKSIWTYQCDWVINLDLVSTNRMIDYLTSKQWTIRLGQIYTYL